MLKACTKCGQIHKNKSECKVSRSNYVRDEKILVFRKSSVWQNKRKEIIRRDLYMCQYCLEELGKVNNRLLSVHHIKPLKDNWDLRLEDSNLVTLCSVHHALIDKEQINIPPTPKAERT